MLLTLPLRPGLALGPFHVGMPITKAVAQAQEGRSEPYVVEVKWCPAQMEALQEAGWADIVLNIPEAGMHLRFEPVSQRLRLIEVYDLTRMQIRYSQTLVGGASNTATFVRIYDLFGPTFPGELDLDNAHYTLHYPGLSFMFPLPRKHLAHLQQAVLPLELPDGTTPVASRICIYSGTLGSAAAINTAPPPQLKAGSSYFEEVAVILEEGLVFTVSECFTRFGSSAQDILAMLGPPQGTYSKTSDNSAIRPGQGGAAHGQSGADYLYNYFSRGVDILFCGKTHRAKKFILHTNRPGHCTFNMYAKCNFSVRVKSDVSPEQCATKTSTGSPILRDPSTGSESAGADNGDAAASEQFQGMSVSNDCGTKATNESSGASNIACPDAATCTPTIGSTSATEPDRHVHTTTGTLSRAEKKKLKKNAKLAAANATAHHGHQDGGSEQGRADPASGHAGTLPLAALQPTSRDHTPAQGLDTSDACPSERLAVHDSTAESIPTLTALPRTMGCQAVHSMQDVTPTVDSGTHVSYQDTVLAQVTTDQGLVPKEVVRLAPMELPCLDPHLHKGTITPDSTWEAVQLLLGPCGRATIHTSISGSNPFGPTYVYGYSGIVFEVMANGHLASVTLYDPRCKAE